MHPRHRVRRPRHAHPRPTRRRSSAVPADTPSLHAWPRRALPSRCCGCTAPTASCLRNVVLAQTLSAAASPALSGCGGCARDASRTCCAGGRLQRPYARLSRFPSRRRRLQDYCYGCWSSATWATWSVLYRRAFSTAEMRRAGLALVYLLFFSPSSNRSYHLLPEHELPAPPTDPSPCRALRPVCPPSTSQPRSRHAMSSPKRASRGRAAAPRDRACRVALPGGRAARRAVRVRAALGFTSMWSGSACEVAPSAHLLPSGSDTRHRQPAGTARDVDCILTSFVLGALELADLGRWVDLAARCTTRRRSGRVHYMYIGELC